mgnify:FL=1|jgi:hypothetical protein
MTKGKVITGTPTLEVVTPLVAANALAASSFNPRPISMSEVKKFEQRLKSGRWFFTSDAVVIDDKENVINGQTRLTAIARSGISAQLLVMRGVPSAAGIKAAVVAQDSGGRNRTLAQTLNFYGQENSTRAASIITQFGRYLTQTQGDEGLKNWSEPFGRDKDVFVDIWFKHGRGTPELAAAIQDLQNSTTIYGKQHSAYGAISFAWRRAAAVSGDEALAKDVAVFFDEFFNPDSSQVSAPLLKVRDKIRRNLAAPGKQQVSGGSKVPMRLLAIYTAHAWNAWYMKEDLTKSRLTVTVGGSKQTPLPHVHGITEAAAAWLPKLKKAYGDK